MVENRESVISVRSANFKDGDVKFQIGFHMDFSTIDCTERMNKIKEIGIVPSENAIVAVHEFPTEEAAEEMVNKINELKAVFGAQTEKIEKLIESVKKVGKKVVVCARIPPEATAPLVILEMMSGSMGDFAAKREFVDFRISHSKELKDILDSQNSSIAANVLDAMSIKLVLSLNKEFPVKMAEFLASLAPEHEKERVKMMGHFISSFHHLRLEVELQDPSQTVKEAYKNELMMGLMGLSQMAYQMGEQFGVIEAMKKGGSKTNIMLCLNPVLSFEVDFMMPTAVDTLEKIAKSSL